MDVEATTTEQLTRCAIAIVIGALVGLERQARMEVRERDRRPPDPAPSDPAPPEAETASSDAEQIGGVRTFVVIALTGAVATMSGSPWIFVAAFLAVALLVVAGYALTAYRTQGDLGFTSELAALTVFLLGGLCGDGRLSLAAAAGLILALILSLKERLHRFASRMRKEDIQAVVKFAALSVIVLPLLPAEPLPVGASLAGSTATVAVDGIAIDGVEAAPVDGDPVVPPWYASLTLDVRKVWWMVILISSISFVGFILGKFIGAKRGLLVTAGVGGLVSSTAVSLTYAQRSHQTPALATELTMGILLANVIMPIRVVAVLFVVCAPLAIHLAVPMGITAGAGALAALVLYLRRPGDGEMEDVELKNPFELASAVKFGLLFGVVLFGAQIVQALFGDAGLYGLSVASGLTDVDPVALTSADLVASGRTSMLVGVVMVTLAVISNTAVKGGLVISAGDRSLRGSAIFAFGAMLLAAFGGLGLAVFLWRSGSVISVAGP